MTPSPLEIYTSRSAVEARQKCQRYRYLSYHRAGTGLTKRGEGYAAEFGQLIHKGFENMLRCVQEGTDPLKNVHKVGNMVMGAVNVHFGKSLSPDQLTHMKKEQIALADFLLYGWAKHRLQRIVDHYDIVTVEVERSYVFEPIVYLPSQFASTLRPVKVPFRFDALLRRKSDKLLHILDFKTATQANEDWNVNLDNSLQSNLYIEAAEQMYDEPVGGIFYEGLVKGRRELDKAKSSPYSGQPIQYGSPLYGWKDKAGVVHKDYVSGRRRQFIPADAGGSGILVELQNAGHDTSQYFPTTVPWRPLNIGMVVGAMIVKENEYANNLEEYESIPEGHPCKVFYEQTLFEPSLGMCYKYGSRNPCEMVAICHEGIHEDEIGNFYEPRKDHHEEPVEK